MKLDREKIFQLYMGWVDKVPDEKSIFSPKEIVYAICDIIEKQTKTPPCSAHAYEQHDQ